MKTKICTTCGIEKEATTEYFYKQERGLYGLRSKCKECNSNLAKNYYIDNREYLKEYTKNYRGENPIKVKITKKKYSENNKEKISKGFKDWYYKNHEYNLQRVKGWRNNNPKKHRQMLENGKEDKLVYNKQYYQDNKETMNKRLQNWRKENPELNAIYVQVRRHRKKNTITSYNMNIWGETLEYFNNECAYCGTTKKQLTQEHIIPLVKGGGYLRSNIIPACQNCNSSKGIKDMAKWYKQQPYYNKKNLLKIKKWAGTEDEIQQISIL